MSTMVDASHSPGLTHLTFFNKSTGDDAIDADLKYIQSIDWSSSSIGSIASWPPELLVLIHLAMLSPQPQLFLLGPDSIILYNTAYGRLLRDHHPAYQGRPIHLDDALIAQARAINRIVGRAKTRSQPANENRVPFFFLSNGLLEEVFLSATMVELPQSLGGFHATTYDTTAETVLARRNYTLDQVHELARPNKDLPSLWPSICTALSTAEDDISFAILYCAHTELVKDPQTDALSWKVDAQKFRLCGTVGTFDVSPPDEVDLTADDKWIVALREAAAAHTSVLINTDQGILPEEFSQAARNRCYNDECREAVILPSALDSGADIHCLMIIGLAPRRPYDHAYQSWIQTLHRTIANYVASITMTEDRHLARENENKRAARERDVLAKELSLKKQEAALAAGKIQRMLGIMQSANVGVFECLPSGQLIHTNESFSRLCGYAHDSTESSRQNILHLCHPDDVMLLEQHWASLVSGQPLTFTIRFRAKDHDNKVITRWLQAACVPVFNSASAVESISGCITDISAQKNLEHEAIKRAEALEQLRLNEARILQEAIEAKRQQENFIDMTSHEIRNPLGVVLHCIDALSQTLSDMKTVLDDSRTDTSTKAQVASTDRLYEIRAEISEVVGTIMSCTMHQKRITDDILLLSKLDSDLLEIAPSTFNVESFLQQVYNTFAPEAARAEVTLNTMHDASMAAMGINWIRADPGRLMQVLVNLIANAIKFTKGQGYNRAVTISIGACTNLSMKPLDGLAIAQKTQSTEHENIDMADNAFYLWFKVEDSGCGMDAVSRGKMFARFSQASPKTYNTYGGSGLGLFISKQLVALQGGEIGFKSEQNSGSTFAFYVEASKAVPPNGHLSNSSEGTSVSATNGVVGSSLSTRTSQLSILLVEDNLINQKVLSKQLIRHGFVVSTADNGQSAFDFITTTQHWSRSAKNDVKLPCIDVILMDIEMPIMDGLECASLIRAAEGRGDINKHIPIIAVTANARPEQLKHAIEIGMDDAISKPFRVPDLKPVFERLGLYDTKARQDYVNLSLPGMNGKVPVSVDLPINGRQTHTTVLSTSSG